MHIGRWPCPALPAANAAKLGPCCILRPLGFRRRSNALASIGCKARRGLPGRSRRQAHVTADSAIVPDMPFPGDDQGSIIYSTLSSIEASAADALQKAEKAADGSVEPSTSGRGDEPTASSNGIMPDPKKKPPVPHRWVIVGAMALAFVLCNMDKVTQLLC